MYKLQVFLHLFKLLSSFNDRRCSGRVCTEVDLYFAPFDNVFMVNVDAVTGFHRVSIDPRYRYTRSRPRARRHALNNTANSTDDQDTTVYELHEQTASQFVTFVSVTHADMFLVVRHVRNRLVMMLPNTAHQLKVSRFYMVLSGSANSSYGIVYFRQDQPHIDLFVFFSVFFSCFFLFLAGCVLLWKAKQAVDRQRSRHRRQIEMHDMASRPFASVLVHVPHTHTHSQASDSVDSVGLRLNVVAVEPTRSGSAVVATLMVELPCSWSTDCSAPTRACLGSCLLTPRSLHAAAGPASAAAATTPHHFTVKHSTRPRTSVT